jgi:CheY-like chemotaxis protein
MRCVRIPSTFRTQKGHKKDMTFPRTFLRELRRALNHLYDPNVLRASPLCSTLVPQSTSPCTTLREVLIQAIASLKPTADVPAHSRLWRIYEILLYRYVQQCSQDEVADQLGISVRHLRREQREAIEVLAQRLVDSYPLDMAAFSNEETTTEVEANDQDIGEDPQDGVSVEGELAWLHNAPASEPVELAAVLSAVLDLCRPMAARHNVSLRIDPKTVDATLIIHPVALRQILLGLMTLAIQKAEHSSATVCVEKVAHWACISTRCWSQGQGTDSNAVQMLRRLIKACEGELHMEVVPDMFVAQVRLPLARQRVALVLDDNRDTLNLFERYSAGTEWRIIGTTDPTGMVNLAEQTQPDLIVLDVMMPRLDGWAMLGRLAEHPRTEHIPILVCTILPHEELALSLGASGFVAKPVSREGFVEALRRHAVENWPTSD